MKIAIIKYNAGNARSVSFALERLGVSPLITDDAEQITNADKVIFPGVGEASTAMNFLKKNNLDTLIKELQQPVLGICLGMQLLCKHSEEGNTSCLNIIDANVKKFKGSLKIPQIGWNTVYDLKLPLFKNVNENSYFYFVHGYYLESCGSTISTTDYIVPFSSAINKNNFYGVQFHPEKSETVGEQVLKNFIELK